MVIFYSNPPMWKPIHCFSLAPTSLSSGSLPTPSLPNNLSQSSLYSLSSMHVIKNSFIMRCRKDFYLCMLLGQSLPLKINNCTILNSSPSISAFQFSLSFAKKSYTECPGIFLYIVVYIVAVVQLLSRVRLFEIPQTTACQAPLSSTISQNLLKFMSIDSVMLPNHLILCRLNHLLPSIFPSIRVFSNELAFCIR